jgi:hypothetical protein
VAPDRWDAFAGQWRAHSFTLDIQPDGTATADWRTYRWCQQGAVSPCDEMRGGRITPGGHAALVFDRAADGGAAGRVVESTDQAVVPLAPARLLLLPTGRVRLVLGLDDQQATEVELCGARTGWSTACGA